MPLSDNFAIQAKSLLQSSLNFHFLFGAIFQRGLTRQIIGQIIISRERRIATIIMENSVRNPKNTVVDEGCRVWNIEASVGVRSIDRALLEVRHFVLFYKAKM